MISAGHFVLPPARCAGRGSELSAGKSGAQLYNLPHGNDTTLLEVWRRIHAARNSRPLGILPPLQLGPEGVLELRQLRPAGRRAVP
jgi:hypothetical protein